VPIVRAFCFQNTDRAQGCPLRLIIAYYVLCIETDSDPTTLTILDLNWLQQMTQNLATSTPVHVTLIEDDKILQARLCSIMSQEPLIAKITACNTVKGFHKIEEKAEIDVALIDIGLPDGSGIEIIEYLADAHPKCLCIVISALSDSKTIMKAIKAGAVGYVHKDGDKHEIVDAIQVAINGGAPISASIARQICISVKSSTEMPNTQASVTDSITLTPRETEALEWLSKGLSYAETAEMLSIAKTTLPVHVRNIYRKLHSKNRTQAVTNARNLGLIK